MRKFSIKNPDAYPGVGRTRAVGVAIALLIPLAATGTVRAQEQETQQSTFGLPGFGIGTFGTQPGYFDVNAGVAYTDNALLSPSDKTSTGIGSAGFDVDYNRAGSNFAVSALGDVDWLQYFDNAYPGAAYGNFNGAAVFGHTTDLFQWLVQETYDDGTANPLAAPTLNELESVNYFTTGPYLNLNLTSTERLSFYGLYSNMAYQKSPDGFQSYDGGAVFDHQLATTSSLSLQVDSAQNDFNDAGVASNYYMRTAQVIYATQLARTRVSAGAGYTVQDFEGPQSGAPYLALDLSRRLTPSQTLTIHAHDQYMTYGEALRSDLGAPTTAALLTPGFLGATTAAPIKDHLAGLGWSYLHGRTALSLSGSIEQELYVQQTLYNGHIATASASAQREVRPTLWLSLQASRYRESYDNIVGNVTSTIVNLSLTKQYRKVGFSLFVQRTHQISTAPGADVIGLGGGTYDEDRVGLNVTYDFIGTRRPPGIQVAPDEAAGEANAAP